MLLFDLKFWRESLGIYGSAALPGFPTDEEHRRNEQTYWDKSYRLSVISLVLTVIAGFTGAIALYLSLDQANVARQALIEDKRAFVGVGELTWKVEDKTKDQRKEIDEQHKQASWLIFPRIRNNGKTPTVGLKWISGDDSDVTKEAIKGGFFPKVDISSSTNKYQRGNAHISAEQDQNAIIQHRIFFPDDLLARKPQPYYFVYGALIYRDSIARKVHVTRYCYGFDEFGAKSARVLDFGFSQYPCGNDTNCADEECSEADQAAAALYIDKK